MRKILVLAAVAAISAISVMAQDFAKATDLAKQANDALVGGDFQTAINDFAAAAAEAAQCSEEECAALIENCKKGIAQANYSLANSLIENGSLKEALEQLAVTAGAAEEAGEAELAEKAAEKTLQLHQAIANAKIKAAPKETDPAIKVATYKEALTHLDAVLEKETDNGRALLQKGQVLNAIGERVAAVESFLKAKECGQEEAADKQLSIIFLKDAAAKLKAKDFSGAVEAALKSNEFKESANAYKIAGTAANGAKDIAAAEQYLSKYLELAPDAKDAAQIKAAVTALQAALKK